MICLGGSGNVTYHNALLLSRLQNALLGELCANAFREINLMIENNVEITDAVLDDIAATVSLEDAEKLIDQKLVPVQAELRVDITSISH